MGSYTGTVPTLSSGEQPGGTKFLEITNFMTAMTAAWTTYTPTWTASAGAVAIGNGTLTGRYRLIGKTVDFEISLVAGSTTTYGTAGAYWTIGAPTVGNAVASYAYPLRLFDAGVLEYAGIAASATATTFELFKPVSGRILNNSPFTFGSGDSLWFNGTYELT